ncbi:MAG: hypothetical protein IH936_12800, partial [Acidobacteria bacterium]|nr:hypothetical protein [Acidobacteriota bacterium]
ADAVEPVADRQQRLDGAAVVAGAVGEPLPVSGWDYEQRMPKPLLHAVPAGSVYFFELNSSLGQERRTELAEELVDKLHFAEPISENVGGHRPEHGVCLLAPWKGASSE